MKQVISVAEARKILGSDADRLTDEEIEELITTLDILAKEALELARQKLRMKNDAEDLANLIYDVYKENNGSQKSS